MAYDDVWERRDVIGVHPQKQEGFSWVGACVPVGRLIADDFFEFARVADTYAAGYGSVFYRMVGCYDGHASKPKRYFTTCQSPPGAACSYNTKALLVPITPKHYLFL